MADSDLITRLAQHRTLGSAPRSELEWLVAHGTLFKAEPGNLLERIPDLINRLSILLSGHFSIYVDHGAGQHKVMEWGGGDVSGFLPYSRMLKPIGEMIIDETMEALLVHRDHFPEMIRDCPAVTETLVHVMLDRARLFRSSELQDEKMLSLGRLSAGLAHELNNPASAAARSARLLSDSLSVADAAARAVGAAHLNDEQLAAIERARTACLIAPPAALSPIERADREEALVEWLEKHDIDSSIAASLAETATTIGELDGLAKAVQGDALVAAVRWVGAGCTTRTLAAEVERAATRIHNLVAAIKRFTYMDRASAPEPVDLAQGLNDSVSLLLHKARKKNVSLSISVEPTLPKVLAIGGDLNQVWMNLIDNALDAVGEGGKVSVSAARRLDSVIVGVVDNGGGIPVDVRDRIFDPFVTTKRVGQGTGLGLDIARQLVRRNNGDIDFESRPGRTEFRVVLPVGMPPVA